MKNKYSVKDKLILLLLSAGVSCFGFILPDSLSDHTMLLHFSAHFGMSFLLALCFYMISTVKLRVTKAHSYAILIGATLFIGLIYKIWELVTLGKISHNFFDNIMGSPGIWRSMSQNLSGLFGAMLLIESLVARNLVLNVMQYGQATSNAIHYGKNVSDRQFSNTSEN